MPNYRQKNKKKNNKKNNKNKNNQNQNQTNNNTNKQQQNTPNQNQDIQNQQGVQQHQKQQDQAITSKRVAEQATKLQHDGQVGNVSNEPTVDNSNKDHVEVAKILTDNLVNHKDDDAVPLNTSNRNADVDTVSKENATEKKLLDDIDEIAKETNNGEVINMGTKHSKEPTTFEVEKTNNNTIDHQDQLCENEAKTQQVKVIIHRIAPEIVDFSNDLKNESVIERQPKVITHSIAVEEEPEDDDQVENENDIADISIYQVQSPSFNDESFENANDNKSTLQIQELFNEDDTQDPDATLSSSAAKNDDYKLKRAQKRVALETHFLPQLLSPRYLDSILEENSDLSDCSDRPAFLRSLSASSGETEYSQELRSKRANAKFPRSHLDFSKTHKHGDLPNTLPTLPGPISEEPLAMMVEAKLIEYIPNEPQESCTKLTFKHLEEQSENAEVIFINSSTSSSTSDLMELDDQEENIPMMRETIDLDTDANEIISKPNENIIEYMTQENDISTCPTDRETTPVNSTIGMEIASIEAAVKTEGATNTQILIANEEYDHLNSDEQFSQCSTETIVDVSQASTSASEQPQIADIKSFLSDDSSVLSTTSISNSSIVDASAEESSSAEAFARLEETCREIMDNVREIVYANGQLKHTNEENLPPKPIYKGLSYGLPSFPLSDKNVTYTPYNINGKQKSPTPPPIPPPPQLDTYTSSENAYIKATNNYAQPSVSNQPQSPTIQNTSALQRQESADSHCSSSTNQSQCTAINVAVNSTQRDIDVSSPIFSDNLAKTTANNTVSELLSLKQKNSESIQKLRQLCTQKLASLPYGEHVLVELATLAKNIGKMPREEEVQSNLKELEEMISEQQQQYQKREQKQVKFVVAEQESSFQDKPHEIMHKILLDNEQLLSKRCENETINTNVNIIDEALRKRLTPSPPPLPPPPVPMKSIETVAKAQQQQQMNSRIIPIVFEKKNDASNRNVNAKEQKTTFTMLNEDDSIKQQQQIQAQQNFANDTATKTSSVENNSRQTENNYATGKEFIEEKHFNRNSEKYQNQSSSSSFSNNNPLNEQHHQPRPLGEIQSMETEIGRMFPNLGSANIFDDTQKRFSNIESNSRTSFPIINPKRYSNIETSSYETQKRIENGKVVYDFENKEHETLKDGDEVDTSVLKNATKIHDIQIDTQKVPENMRSTFNNNEHSQTTKNTLASDEFKQTTNKIGIDEKKLFRDFDELSQQLHHELETGRQQREEREKSASLFDLNRVHMKHQLDELKKYRHDHLKELECEIQRSMKSRESRREMSNDILEQQKQKQQQQQHNVHEIPIKVEPKDNEEHKTYDIPVYVEGPHSADKSEFQHDANSPFRRSESLFNLSNTNQSTENYARPRTASSNYEGHQQLLSDDWSQYASDLGSSENIVRPFARETQVCYQRMSPRPREIRAPRLTVSSHDLSSTTTFDPHNAYNVPRTKRAPSTSLYSLYERDTSTSQGQSTDCYSVLKRDPNPTYIGTTSRRGVSPAPVQPNNRPTPAPRRASLPREIHEQQLKYLTSKEEELRMEFDRLQNERRRLMEEMHREQSQQQEEKKQFVEPQVPPRSRDKTHYRGAPRLPTLSEDEVLRQQMAEEWMNKVAEREERRLQKTIKISKIQEEQLGAKQFMEDPHTALKPDLSQEFLERVKERRHKLDMPADSDWESGAESQPNKTYKQEEGVPEIRVLSGKSVADLHNLPQHLKEFARYSNQETEQLVNGGNRSVFEEEERRQESTPYSSSSATKKSTVATTYKVARQPPQTLAPGQGECLNIQESAISKNINSTTDLLDHASTSFPAVNNNNITNDSLLSSSSPSPTTNQTSISDTGSFLGKALAIGMGVLGAWARLS